MTRAAEPPRKVHLPHWEKPGFTLCGQGIAHSFQRRQLRPRPEPLLVIGKNQGVDESTCQQCWRADDAFVVRSHRRECQEAGIDPDTLEKIK